MKMHLAAGFLILFSSIVYAGLDDTPVAVPSKVFEGKGDKVLIENLQIGVELGCKYEFSGDERCPERFLKSNACKSDPNQCSMNIRDYGNLFVAISSAYCLGTTSDETETRKCLQGIVFENAQVGFDPEKVKQRLRHLVGYKRENLKVALIREAGEACSYDYQGDDKKTRDCIRNETTDIQVMLKEIKPAAKPQSNRVLRLGKKERRQTELSRFAQEMGQVNDQCRRADVKPDDAEAMAACVKQKTDAVMKRHRMSDYELQQFQSGKLTN